MSSKKSSRSSRKLEVTSLGEKLLALKNYQRSCGGCRSEYGYRSSSNQTARKRNVHVHSVAMTVVKTDGYSLSRSASKIRMNIHTAAFFGDDSDPSELRVRQGDTAIPFSGYSLGKRRPSGSPETCDRLQVQLTELKLEMAREREEQSEYINQLEYEFEEEKDNLKATHEQQMNECEIEHKSFVAKLQELHENQVRSNKEEAAVGAGQLQSELVQMNELKVAEHAQLTQENEENLKIKTQEIEVMGKVHKGQIEKMEEILRQYSPTNIQVVREKMMADYKREKNTLYQSHKNEIEDLFSQITVAKEFGKKAHQSRKLLKKEEKRNLGLKHELNSSEAKQIEIKAELLQAETALANFEKMFEQKVKDAEAKLTDRLDDLVLENAQLRRKLLTKSEEFCEYKINVELANSRRVKSFREKVQVMLKARARAELGVALGIFAEDRTSRLAIPEQRPSSAPSTQRESGLVRHTILSAEATLTQRLRPKASCSVPSRGYF